VTLREATAALFVLGLSLVSALIGWTLADVLGLTMGLALGLIAADRITRVVERDDAWSVVTRRR
jgi:ABC-type nickel/cobalt efflux system permease component RcnA